MGPNHTMGGSKRSTNASIQAYLTPTPSPTKPHASRSGGAIGDGFTATEVQDALRPTPTEVWHPVLEYADRGISELEAGPKPVTFMGRVANIFDATKTPRTPRSARGCLKLCLKDACGAITVRLWYAHPYTTIRLGSLLSVWTNHISNGENSMMSSAGAPLFVSLFPRRDRNCHVMVHQNSDDGKMFDRPLGFREGVPLDRLMTVENFLDGGYDVTDGRILVVVKSVGAKKKITRQDGTVTENLNVQVQDDTGEAMLGLWGTLTWSALTTVSIADTDIAAGRRGWKPGETVLLIQNPGWKFGRTTYLSFNSSTIIDIDPDIPDAHWLRRWALRQRTRDSINPQFPVGVFEPEMVQTGPVRCLFTIGELDEFARCSPDATFQGYLSLLIMEFKLLEYWKRHMLLSAECCNIPIYANATNATCKGCDEVTMLRLNPRIIGQVVDETAVIAGGKLLLSDQAWYELLGCDAEDLLRLGYDEIKNVSDRVLFSRVSFLFGWTGDESKSGGRICVFGVRS